MPRLSHFIREHIEEIAAEWETLARGLPAGELPDVSAPRDHAKATLEGIAGDLERPQAGAASDHVSLRTEGSSSVRQEGSSSVRQTVSEFLALRTSVMRLWARQWRTVGEAEFDEMIRFNEAIDQAIVESFSRYTHDIDQTRQHLLTMLGHDLRSTLSAVITSGQFLLETGGLSENQLVLVTGVVNSGRRVNQMLTDLRDFTATSLGDSRPIVRAGTEEAPAGSGSASRTRPADAHSA